MKGDNRLSRMLYVSTWPSAKGPVTSEEMAQMSTPILSSCVARWRDCASGFVQPSAGTAADGDWRAPRHHLCSTSTGRSIGRRCSLRIAEDTPGCLVEQAVNAALDR